MLLNYSSKPCEKKSFFTSKMVFKRKNQSLVSLFKSFFIQGKHFKFSFLGFQAALLLVLRAVFLVLAVFIFFVSTISLYAQTAGNSPLYFVDLPLS